MTVDLQFNRTVREQVPGEEIGEKAKAMGVGAKTLEKAMEDGPTDYVRQKLDEFLPSAADGLGANGDEPHAEVPDQAAPDEATAGTATKTPKTGKAKATKAKAAKKSKRGKKGKAKAAKPKKAKPAAPEQVLPQGSYASEQVQAAANEAVETLAKGLEGATTKEDAAKVVVTVQKAVQADAKALQQAPPEDMDSVLAQVVVHPADVDGMTGRKRRVYWQEELAHVVAEAMLCAAYSPEAGSNAVAFVGPEAYAQAAADVWVALCAWGEAAARHDHRQYREGLKKAENRQKAEAKGYRKGWYRSLVYVVAHRAGKVATKQQAPVQAASAKAAVAADTERMKPVGGPSLEGLPGASAGAEEGTSLRPSLETLQEPMKASTAGVG